MPLKDKSSVRILSVFKCAAGTGLSLLEELKNITIAANTTECGEFNHFGYLAHSIG